jgi:hypothetical protein
LVIFFELIFICHFDVFFDLSYSKLKLNKKGVFVLVKARNLVLNWGKFAKLRFSLAIR